MRLDPIIRDGVRLKAVGILSKLPHRQRHNLPAEEVTALRKLREDTEIVLLPANKGKSTVVLDRELYEEKIRDHLGSHVYKKLKKDPMPQVQSNLNKILAEIFKK